MRKTSTALLISFLLMLFLPVSRGLSDEYTNATKDAIALGKNPVNNALILSGEEIYLCGLEHNGSWLTKTNVRHEILLHKNFTNIIGSQPVIQCLTKINEKLVLGLVDSHTQKAAVAILDDAKTEYFMLPENQKVLLSSINGDSTGLSLISYSDEKSKRVIYYTHVSYDGSMNSFQVGASTIDDMVIADSFACASENTVYVLRMTKIDGVTNNAHRELLAFAPDGQPLWQMTQPSDVVITGIALDQNLLYLYGFQRLETGTRALLMSYTMAGKLQWVRTYDEFERFRHLTIDNESLYICGEAETLTGKWLVSCLDKNGARIWVDSIVLPSAYQTFWLLTNTQINAIQNFDGRPYLWQMRLSTNETSQ